MKSQITNGGNSIGIMHDDNVYKELIYGNTYSNWGWSGIYLGNLPSSTAWTKYKFVKTGTSYACYVNDTLKGTRTDEYKHLAVQYINYGSTASAYVRNIKIKSA